jgi:hypothetical protein
MKSFLMFMVHSVKKTVRKVLQVGVSLPGRDGKWIDGVMLG